MNSYDFFSKLRTNPQLAQALAYYVDSVVTPDYRRGIPEDLENKLEAFLKGSKPIMLIRGDSGSGKSTFMHHFAQKLFGTSGRIPLLIELKTIPEKFLTSAGTLGNFFETCLREQYPCSEAEMAELRQKGTVILLDGFDEMKGKPCNLFTANQLSRWNCKVVITCRHESLLHEDYRGWFVVDQEFHKECEECFIAPFSKNQIDHYLKKVCETPHEWDLKKYQEALAGNKELGELIENPLLLRMVVEVLPTLNLNEKVSRYGIYEAFVKQWFDREEMRLKKQMGTQTKLKGLPPYEAFSRFSMRLAMKMCQQGVIEVEYRSFQEAGEEDEFSLGLGVQDQAIEKQWEEFFTEKDEETVKTRAGCPLKRAGEKYSFYHKSLLEFFVAAYLHKTLHLDKFDEKVHRAVVQQVAKLPINGSYLSSEPAIIAFLADTVQHREGPIQRLMDIVEASKNRPELSCAASNAITVLNRARVPFCWKDWFSIQVPKASLEGANFVHCNLCSANLERTFLRGVWLNQVNIRGANLRNVQFGELPTLQHKGGVHHLAYSPDGKLIASGAGSTVTIWNAETSTIQHTLQGHESSVRCLAFSPNGGRLATGSDDQTVRIWDVLSGSSEHTLQGHGKAVSCLAFSPNGDRLATGSDDQTVRIWDVLSDSSEHILQGHRRAVSCLAFSPNSGRLATGSDDKTVRIWDVQTGTSKHTLQGHRNWVNCLAFSSNDSRLATGSNDQTVRIWDVLSGSSEHTLQGHGSSVSCLAFSSNGGRLATGSDDKTVRIWDVQSGSSEHILQGHGQAVSCLAFSSNGSRLATGSDDQTVRIWDVLSGSSEHTLQGHGDSVSCLAFSPNGGRLATGSDDKTVRIWDVLSGSSEHILQGHRSSVLCLAFSPNGGRLATGSDDQTVRIWDVQSGSSEHALQGHGSGVNCLEFSPNGGRLATGSEDCTVRIWDIQSGKQAALLTLPTGVTRLAYEGNDKLAVACRNGDVFLWKQEPGSDRWSLQWAARKSVMSTPDTRLLGNEASPTNMKLLEQRGAVIEGQAPGTSAASAAAAAAAASPKKD